MKVKHLIEQLRELDPNETIIVNYWVKEDLVDVNLPDGSTLTDEECNELMKLLERKDKLDEFPDWKDVNLFAHEIRSKNV